jgi:hypothetical protein
MTTTKRSTWEYFQMDPLATVPHASPVSMEADCFGNSRLRRSSMPTIATGNKPSWLENATCESHSEELEDNCVMDIISIYANMD